MTMVYLDIQSLFIAIVQTLVYENYNKFISATDTIRRMKDDFKHMEEQMEVLLTNQNSFNFLLLSFFAFLLL